MLCIFLNRRFAIRVVMNDFHVAKSNRHIIPLILIYLSFDTVDSSLLVILLPWLSDIPLLILLVSSVLFLLILQKSFMGFSYPSNSLNIDTHHDSISHLYVLFLYLFSIVPFVSLTENLS